MSERRPKLAVLAVCVQEGKLLLVRRKNPPDAGKWGFPGGHVEWGEALAGAAIRELDEETGITATPGAVIDHIEMITREGAEISHHFLLVAIRCHYRAGVAVAADDALAVDWVTLEELESGTRPLSEAVLETARKALA